MLAGLLAMAYVVGGAFSVVLYSVFEEEIIDPLRCFILMLLWPLIMCGYALSKLSEVCVSLVTKIRSRDRS